jgi:hypothetical protein
MSKGSRPRPMDKKKFNENFSKIFNKQKKHENNTNLPVTK